MTHLIEEPEVLCEAESSLQVYREGVQELFQLKSTAPISNAIPAHASIIFETFFRYSKVAVRIFCKNLNAEVFGAPNLVEEARNAIRRNVSIRIIVQESVQESVFTSVLREAQILVHRPIDPTISTFDLNFAVMDDVATRIEKDRNQCKAVATMFDSARAPLLVAFFEKMLPFCPAK